MWVRDRPVVFTYVHDEDLCGVEFLDDPFGGNGNRRREKGGLLLYTGKNKELESRRSTLDRFRPVGTVACANLQRTS